MGKKPDFGIFILSILAAAGSVFLLISTKRWGAGVSPDSVTYITAARNLLSGDGLTILSAKGTMAPMTHYPPLFSVLLAALGLGGIDPLQGARWLGALFFGANIMMTGLIVRRFTKYFALPVFASLIILTSNTMITAHALLMSEPVFLFFGALALYLLAEYLSSGKRPRLIGSAAATGFAFLARYPGIVFVAVAAAGIVFLSKQTRKRKITDLIIFLTISLLPMIFWFARNLYTAGSATNRRIVFHLISIAHLQRAAITFSTWLLPGMPPSETNFLLAVSAIALLAAGIWLTGDKADEGVSDLTQSTRTTLPLLMGLFIPVYFVFLSISISLFDALTPLNFRIMSPVYIFAVALSMWVIDYLFRSVRGARMLKVVLVILCVAFAGLNLSHGNKSYAQIYDDGLGLSGRYWTNAQIVRELGLMDKSTKLYTNAPELVYFFTGIKAAFLPSKGEGAPNEDYESELADMERKMRDNGAVILYISGLTWRWFLPTEKELKEKLQLTAVVRTPEGNIYKILGGGEIR